MSTVPHSRYHREKGTNYKLTKVESGIKMKEYTVSGLENAHPNIIGRNSQEQQMQL